MTASFLCLALSTKGRAINNFTYQYIDPLALRTFPAKARD